MKITATRENLVFAVSAVQKAVSTKQTMPILSCIRIEAKQNLVYFSATDLEMGIECFIPAEIIEEGVSVVPARYFSEIVRKLPDVAIVLQQGVDNELLIKYNESQLSLRTLTTEDFPKITEVIGDYEIQVQSLVLKQMIKQSVFAAGTDEGRPLFTGLLCEGFEDKLRLVATDTHRLALRQGEIQNRIEKELVFIIPGKMLNELARLMYEDDEICYISLTKNLSSFKFSNIRIICRLLEGQFPNYHQVIPEKYKSKIVTNTKLIKEAIERIALFSAVNDNSNTINIKIENSSMVISSRSELGQGYEKMNIELEGEDIDISFNARYLADVFKIMESELASIEFSGPLSPCIVRPAESKNFLYLLLPVRT